MCIVGIARGLNASLPLVVLHSRDEFMDRPVQVPELDGDVVFARDVREGGTWCGYNTRTGVFAALTNVRVKVGKPEGAISRGRLVHDILFGGKISFADIAGAAEAGASPLILPGAEMPSELPSLPLGASYAPFNLVVAHACTGAAYFMTNMAMGVSPPHLPDRAHVSVQLHPLPPDQASVVRLASGVHAVSNSCLNDASWSKVEWTRRGMDRVVRGMPALQELDARYNGPGKGSSSAIGQPAQPHAVHTSASEVALVESLLRELVPVMTHVQPLHGGAEEAGARTADLSWSPLPPNVEAHLQRQVFIPPHALDLPGVTAGPQTYGTRSLTVFARVGGHAYFAYRSFDPQDASVVRAGQPGQVEGEGGLAEAGHRSALSAVAHRARRAVRQGHRQGESEGQGMVESSTSGVVHRTAAEADELALHSAVQCAAASGVGVGVSRELVHAGDQDMSRPRGTELPASEHFSKTMMVAGLEWSVFRFPVPAE